MMFHMVIFKLEIFSNDIGWYALNYITIKLNLPFATLNTVAAIIFLIGIF